MAAREDKAFNGSITDISVVDLMEILHYTRKSGVMLMRRGLDQAEIYFSRGNVVAASSTTVPQFISDHLVQAGAVDRATIERALQAQSTEDQRRPIGSILLEMGAVEPLHLEAALGNLIGQIVRDAVAWEQGSVEFRLESTEAYRNLKGTPDQWSLDVPIDTMELIKSGLRLYSDRNHRGGDPGEAVREDDGDEIAMHLERALGDGIAPRHRALLMYSSDPELRKAFRDGAQARGWVTYIHADVAEWTAHLQCTGIEGGGLNLAVFDLSGQAGPADEQQLELLERTAGRLADRLPLIPIFDSEDLNGQARAQAAGFGRILSRPRPRIADPAGEAALTESFLAVAFACVEAALDEAAAGHREPVDRPDSASGNWMLEFVRNRSSASVSLSLLRFLAENAERSVLFINRGRDLLAIGAFGSTQTGDTISSCLPRLTLSCGADPVKGVVRGRGLFYGEPGEDQVSQALFQVIGRPANQRVLMLPVTILDRVALVAYCDNGLKKKSIESSIGSLEAISRYAGLVLENSLLRKKVKDRQLSR